MCPPTIKRGERDGHNRTERDGASRKQEGRNKQGSRFMRRKLFNMPEAELAAQMAQKGGGSTFAVLCLPPCH